MLPAMSASASTAAPGTAQIQTLPNGLQWLARRVPGSQAAVRVAYRVGARDDPPGRAGLSHLVLRALSAGASRYLEAGRFQRLLAQAGGSGGVQPDEDFSALDTLVPAHQLERVLWAEAERMSNPLLDEAALTLALAQLRQAHQQALMPPYARLEQAAVRQGYLLHPYQRGALGDPDQLADVGPAELKAFHAAHFRCDRALLVVSGEFDAEQLARWVQHHFGSIRPPLPGAGPSPSATLATSAPSPVASPTPQSPGPAPAPPASPNAAPSSGSAPPVQEPRRPQSQTVRLALPRLPLPAAALVWQAPPAGDPQALHWQMAHALLGRGRSGRLTDTLVDEQGLAHQLSLRLVQHQQGGLLIAQGLGARGQSAAPLAEALKREVLRLPDEPISPEEFDKARALLRRAWQAREATPEALARTLSESWIRRGDPLAASTDLAALEPPAANRGAAQAGLTSEAVQQLWRRLVVPAPVLTLLCDAGGAA